MWGRLPKRFAPLSVADDLGAITSLRPSQQSFLWSPQTIKCLDGGWGCGKTSIGCLHGLILSAEYPGNVGIIGRFNSSDLEDSTMMKFWEVCPASWIKDYQKTRKTLILKNGSVIMFRHINDPNPKRSHLTSTNLGWFFIDQAEEIEKEHFNKMLGRLRLARATKRFALLGANPAGHDWLYDMFFQEIGDQPFEDGSLFKSCVSGNRLGVAVRSEENRKSNGGHVDDSYFDMLRETMPAEWCARMLDCSFSEPTGKIYKAYQLDSVHNIQRFKLEDHWPIVVPIDVGGAHPWAVTPLAVDDYGNAIQFANLSKPGLITSEVAHWIKENVPRWKDAKYIIDPENKLAMLELREYGITCQPAMKAVVPGITRVMGRLKAHPQVPLPDWYKKTQPQGRYDKFHEGGSPSYFVFDDVRETRHGLHNYVYDLHGKPKKEKDDECDAVRYGIMALPEPGRKRIVNRKREDLRKIDPVAAREWDLLEARIQNRQNAKKFGWSREEHMEESVDLGSDAVRRPVRGTGELEAEEAGYGYVPSSVDWAEMVD